MDIKRILLKVFKVKKYNCNILEIDVNKQMVLISYTGVDVCLKISILDIIYDNSIIKNIPITHASRLGYFYGLVLDKNNSCDLNKPLKMDFFLEENSNNKYVIKFINRDGSLVYMDKYKRLTFRDLPINIYNNRKIIEGFSQSQAMYIGFLAYKSLSKKNRTKSLSMKNFLRVV